MLRLIRAVFLAPPAVPDRPNVREAPVLSLLPMLALVAGSLWVGMFPQWAATQLAWPAAEALVASERYTVSVMNPADVDTLSELELDREPVPHALDWHHWLAPAVVVVGGSLLAYATQKRRVLADKAWAVPFEEVSQILRLWHSGIINDYALWAAFGTALLLLAFVLTTRVY
jgi:NADH:ubiquinone oxidoreductase subunit 5 (subunit L)/multisubunit Na+/H+ antiporter MnhA subunit